MNLVGLLEEVRGDPDRMKKVAADHFALLEGRRADFGLKSGVYVVGRVVHVSRYSILLDEVSNIRGETVILNKSAVERVKALDEPVEAFRS